MGVCRGLSWTPYGLCLTESVSDSAFEDPIPRPLPLESISCDDSKPYSHFGDSCYPSDTPPMPAFSVSEVFGRPIRGACPLAEHGQKVSEPLCVNVPSARGVSPLTQCAFTERRPSGNIRCFNMSGKTMYFNRCLSLANSLSGM